MNYMSQNALIPQERSLAMIDVGLPENEERSFGEFRRKVREAEVLSAAMQRLLQAIRFNGRLSVLVQNGQVLKSGYEEGYFKHSGADVTARLQ
jgi:hypothetical protein